MGTSTQCSASIPPGEIVLAGTPIVVRFEQPISRDSLGGISVKGHPAATQIADDTLNVTVDTSALPVGAHTLAILGLSQFKGRERLGDSTLPFLIVPSPAKIPAEIAVIHAARLRIGKLGVERLAMRRDAETPWVDAFKAIDRKNGEPTQLAFDHTGSAADLNGLLATISKRRAKIYGRCHPVLYETVQESNSIRLVGGVNECTFKGRADCKFSCSLLLVRLH